MAKLFAGVCLTQNVHPAPTCNMTNDYRVVNYMRY